jgi:signal transduction histidine kinase
MSRRRASLVFGLGRDLLLAIAAFGFSLLVLLSLQLFSTGQGLRERSLDEAAQYVARNLQIGPDGPVSLPAPPGTSWTLFGYPTIVFDRAGAVIFKRPETLAATVVDALAEQRLRSEEKPHPLGAVRFFRATLGEQRIVGAALRTRPEENERLILVFKDEQALDLLIDDVVRDFPFQSLRIILPLFAWLLLAGGLSVWRRTRPIARVSAIAETIGPQTLNLRLPEQDVPREVLPIVHSVNGALGRLERAAAAQQEFLRRAAHQLRTPLTILSARAAAVEDAELAAALRGDIGEIARIVTQLLQLNEIDALPDSGDLLADLGAVAEAVRDESTAQAARLGMHLDIVQPDEPVLVRGDPNVIQVAVQNLVDNALQHAPLGTAVMIRAATDGRIEVDDAGPGVPEGVRGKIFEPFWSSDPSGARPGIGLTIVTRIAERYRGEVAVSDHPGGGALFTLRFSPAVVPPHEREKAAAAGLPAGLARRRRSSGLDRAAE